MWSMIDSKVPQEAALDRPHIYWIDEWEYDCKGNTRRPLGFKEYLGEMGTGENVFSIKTPVSEAVAVNPGSVSEALWKIACGNE